MCLVGESQLWRSKASTVSAAELRARMSDVLDSLRDGAERVIVTRRGAPAAVLLSMDRYEAIMDILEDWEDEHDPELAAELQEAREAFERGEGRDFDEVYNELMGERVPDSVRESAG